MCALVFAPGVPDLYKFMFSVPTLALPSIVACRVFRAIKLGFIQECQTPSFRSPLSRVHFTPATEIPLSTCGYEASRNIEIMKTINIEDDSQDDYTLGKAASFGNENVEHLSNHV